ncbi:MAG: NUDIX domain-containing protein [Flavobacteriaceae bacterium]|jgi:mutator protein MutT|nr:NUDIX domain-containing protein [Flavobacteriaceae bacterium]
MYKVFVNEKKLSLSRFPETADKKLCYENSTTLEIAVDLLENTSCPEINVYHENIDKLWYDFLQLFKNIEAAGGIVENKNGEILFIKRMGKWDLPKGKIEKGESPKQAALREIEEETGLNEVEIGDFLKNTYHIYTEKNGEKILKITHWFCAKYSGNETPKPQIEESITETAWKNKHTVKQEIIGKTFKNIELVLGKYFADLKIRTSF